MKVIWFYTGAIIDSIALLIAVVMMMHDHFKGRRGTNNPIMLMLVLALTGLIVFSFYMKCIGKYGFANIALWIPGFPLVAYGLFVLLFIILKPDMK